MDVPVNPSQILHGNLSLFDKGQVCYLCHKINIFTSAQYFLYTMCWRRECITHVTGKMLNGYLMFSVQNVKLHVIDLGIQTLVHVSLFIIQYSNNE